MLKAQGAPNKTRMCQLSNGTPTRFAIAAADRSNHADTLSRCAS